MRWIDSLWSYSHLVFTFTRHKCEFRKDLLSLFASAKACRSGKSKKRTRKVFSRCFYASLACLPFHPKQVDLHTTRGPLVLHSYFFIDFFLRAPLRRMKNLLNWIEFVIEGMTNRFLYPLHGDPLSIPIANSFYFISSESVCLWIWIYQIYWGNIDVKRR